MEQKDGVIYIDNVALLMVESSSMSRGSRMQLGFERCIKVPGVPMIDGNSTLSHLEEEVAECNQKHLDFLLTSPIYRTCKNSSC